MTDDTFSFFEDIVDAPDHKIAIKGKDERFAKTITCTYCGGSGCIECGQSGTVRANVKVQTTGDEQRAKRRAAARKGAETRRNNLHKFWDDNKELLEEIGSATSWSEFAKSLMQQASERPWSEKQLAAATRMADKLKANRERKAQERKAAAPAMDLTVIEELFGNAMASGYKKPSYRAEGLYIKPGKNGALYVLNDDKYEEGYYGPTRVYEGKISEKRFFATRNTESTTEPALARIAADPLAVAIAYGRRTGRCACCGRELTKHSSIEAGIGPICQEKWGL